MTGRAMMWVCVSLIFGFAAFLLVFGQPKPVYMKALAVEEIDAIANAREDALKVEAQKAKIPIPDLQ